MAVHTCLSTKAKLVFAAPRNEDWGLELGEFAVPPPAWTVETMKARNAAPQNGEGPPEEPLILGLACLIWFWCLGNED